MGPDGLRRATEVAILNANYVAARLDAAFPVLYTGDHDRVAHECILDLRPITAATGVTVDDVAKRLIDYGFHAPTMSFPVAGTLMVEPTESRVAGRARPLRRRHARHPRGDRARSSGARSPTTTARWPTPRTPPRTSSWPTGTAPTPASRPPTRSRSLRDGKYWPPVSRIDGGYGDRNLVCACPPPEAFED